MFDSPWPWCLVSRDPLAGPGLPVQHGLRRRRVGTFSRTIFWFAAGVLLALLAALVFVVLSYRLAPSRNTGLEHFDALLVLGAPADEDGGIGIEQQWRTDEAIREFRRGRASRMILSGGAVYNRFVEARVMAAYAEQNGVPAAAIVVEPASRNTLENILNVQAIMDAHGWHSVEVISSPEHLPRAAVLLQRTHLLWRTHAAPTPGRGEYDIARHTVAEALATAVIRIFGLRAMPLLHRLKLRYGI
jgi:uncharacterized SAM-binding protein YcdF (DUF218 family)